MTARASDRAWWLVVAVVWLIHATALPLVLAALLGSAMAVTRKLRKLADWMKPQ